MNSSQLVAHRGWTARYPENTRSGLEAAIDAGARWVEIDVQLSQDGVPYLLHDRTLERVCAVKGALHDMPSALLATYAAHEPGRFGRRFEREPLCTLARFVELIESRPHVHAFVEIKRVAIERFGAQHVLERVLPLLEPIRARTTLISFGIEFLLVARRSCALSLGAVFDEWKDRARDEVEALQPEFIFCDVDGLPAQGSLAHALLPHGASRIVVYEVVDAAVARALAARGVELVETFQIGELGAALDARV